jgi:hypothetical protein
MPQIISEGGAGAFSKAIAFWFGTIATIPTGWVLCNGSNGTPNLSNKILVGTDNFANNNTNKGSGTGITLSGSGASSHNHTVGPQSKSRAEWSHSHGWRGYLGDGYPDGAGDSISAGNSQSYTRQSQAIYEGGGGSHNHGTATVGTSGSNHTHTANPQLIQLLAIMRV